MSDPIADMLTRIRNALAMRHTQVRLPHSNIKGDIAKILQENGFIAGSSVDTSGDFKVLVIELEKKIPATITNLQRVSKPGRRVYASSRDIPLVLGGRGMVIVSTPGGMMSGRQARQKGLGGELICRVW